MNVHHILDRLERVRQVKPDAWTACCPAHEDSSPSLAIADKGDRVLIHCYGGCTFDEIRSALGMQPHEFFLDGKAPKSAAPGVSMRSLNAALAVELITAYVITCDRSKGKQIGAADLARERMARQRIVKAWEVQP